MSSHRPSAAASRAGVLASGGPRPVRLLAWLAGALAALLVACVSNPTPHPWDPTFEPGAGGATDTTGGQPPVPGEDGDRGGVKADAGDFGGGPNAGADASPASPDGGQADEDDAGDAGPPPDGAGDAGGDDGGPGDAGRADAGPPPSGASDGVLYDVIRWRP